MILAFCKAGWRRPLWWINTLDSPSSVIKNNLSLKLCMITGEGRLSGKAVKLWNGQKRLLGGPFNRRLSLLQWTLQGFSDPLGMWFGLSLFLFCSVLMWRVVNMFFFCIFSFFLYFLYWSIFDLQCCVSFRCTAKWLTYTYTYIYSFSYSFPI